MTRVHPLSPHVVTVWNLGSEYRLNERRDRGHSRQVAPAQRAPRAYRLGPDLLRLSHASAGKLLRDQDDEGF